MKTRSLTCHLTTQVFLLDEKLDMSASNKNIERADRVGEKSNDKEGAIVVQFSFYKYEITILINLRGLKFQDFSQETMQIRKEKWKEELAFTIQIKISYVQYRSVICKEGRTPP